MKQDATTNEPGAREVASAKNRRPANPAREILLRLRRRLDPAAFKGSEYGSATAKHHGAVADSELAAAQSRLSALARLLDAPTFRREVEWRKGLRFSRPPDGPAGRLTFQQRSPEWTKQYHEGADGLYMKYDWHTCALTRERFRIPHGSPVPVLTLGDGASFIVHPALVAAGPEAVSAAMLRTLGHLYNEGLDALALAIRLGAALPELPVEGLAAAWPGDAYRAYRNTAKKGEPATFSYVRAGYEVD